MISQIRLTVTSKIQPRIDYLPKINPSSYLSSLNEDNLQLEVQNVGKINGDFNWKKKIAFRLANDNKWKQWWWWWWWIIIYNRKERRWEYLWYTRDICIRNATIVMMINHLIECRALKESDFRGDVCSFLRRIRHSKNGNRNTQTQLISLLLSSLMWEH